MISPSDKNSEVYNSVIASVLINRRIENTNEAIGVYSSQKYN